MSRARPGALAVLLGVALGLAGSAPANAQGEESRVHVFFVPGVSFEQLVGRTELASLAWRGGGALMSLQGGLPTNERDALAMSEQDVEVHWLDPSEHGGLEGVAYVVEREVRTAIPERLLVVVASTTPSAAMRAAGDELHPVIVVAGRQDELFGEPGQIGSLTSDSTRREGVVTDRDVLASIAGFLGEPQPARAAGGSPVRVIPGPPPFELHERYLAQRRMYVPIGIAAGSYAAAAGLLGLAVAFGARLPARVRRVTGWACLSIPLLATALLAAGHLPELSYATVVPFVALVTVVGTLAFSPLEARGVRLIPAGIGVAVLAFLALEAVLTWHAALTPLIGGTHLDGGRFHGLPNALIGLLLGAGLWFAHRLPTAVGVGLLVAVGLFAGLPGVGENLGGAFTLFAGAGLWLAVRERERLGAWWGIAIIASITVVGTAVVLGAHALAPVETHVSRFAEEAGGLAGVLERYADRFQVGLDLIARSPFALIPVLGLPFALWLVLRPPAALAPSLERSTAWRDALLVILLGGVVAYLANDSGPAAAGLAFGTGLGGLLGVSLLSGAGKMRGP